MVMALHRRAGKTQMSLMQLLDSALKSNKKLQMFIYVCPFLRQAKAVAWSRLLAIIEPLRRADAITINQSELSVFFKHNEATLRLFGGDNADALRGLKINGIVIDEVAQIKEELWD